MYFFVTLISKLVFNIYKAEYIKIPIDVNSWLNDDLVRSLSVKVVGSQVESVQFQASLSGFLVDVTYRWG